MHNEHNEYVRLCCIQKEKDKLLLLKYAEDDITETKQLLFYLTYNLMEQCLKHVNSFHKYNEEKNKKYGKLKQPVTEQIKDMYFVEEKFIEYFAKPGNKTREDLMTYVFAHQITDNYYTMYLYNVLVNYLKNEMGDKFWVDHSLYRFELNNNNFPNFIISCNKKYECNTGKINHDFISAYNIINEYFSRQNNNNNNNLLLYKLNTIKKLSNVLNNDYNLDFPELNNPYKDYLIDLIDHIKVYIDMEKAKQYIKRR